MALAVTAGDDARLRRVTQAIAFVVSTCALLWSQSAAANQQQASEALLFDIRKIVAAEQNTGWKIDKYELEDMMPDALVSVCRTPNAARRHALVMAERRVEQLGGPLSKALAKGRKLAELTHLLQASRSQRLLAEALARAPKECPAWIKPTPSFSGIQTDAGRFTLHLEGGGQFVAQRMGQRNDVGAGGTGRVLLGYGLSWRRTLLVGLELGGNALFRRGDESVDFPLQFVWAAPLVLRHHVLTFHHDLEVAPLLFFTDADTRPSYGVRFGVTVGVSTIRIRRIMPWAGLGLVTEYLFANAHRPNLVAIRGGARVGFDWDF